MVAPLEGECGRARHRRAVLLVHIDEARQLGVAVGHAMRPPSPRADNALARCLIAGKVHLVLDRAHVVYPREGTGDVGAVDYPAAFAGTLSVCSAGTR